MIPRRTASAVAVAWAVLVLGCSPSVSPSGGGGEKPRSEGTGAALDAGSASRGGDPYRSAREHMVDDQIRSRGVEDPRVLAAVRGVPRHEFVPLSQRAHAYADRPLPIGYGQTISQPFIVAFMTEQLQLREGARVLEVGTGSGYQAAVLARLAGEVYTIEIVPELAERARQTLLRLGYENVHVRVGDGYRGWPEAAPFDAIMVTAAPDHVPEPLVEQLAAGGRMILPVGRTDQDLILVERDATGVRRERLIPVRFVPMRGEAEQND